MQVRLNSIFKNVYWDFYPSQGEEIIIGEDGISNDPGEKLAACEKIELIVNDFDRASVSLSMKVPPHIPIYSGASFFYDASDSSTAFDFNISILPKVHNLSWYSQQTNYFGTSSLIRPKEIVLGDKLSIYFYGIHSGKARLKFVAPKDIRFQALMTDKI